MASIYESDYNIVIETLSNGYIVAIRIPNTIGGLRAYAATLEGAYDLMIDYFQDEKLKKIEERKENAI